MKIETLIVTTQQTDHHLLDKMNIQTDAIVGNQCDFDSVERFTHNGHSIQWLSLQERGVGLNRNTVMMRSTADVCVFADDDMVFVDGYADIAAKAFAEHPEADIILFNLIEQVPTRVINTKVVQVNKTNYGRYGTARLAFRRQSVLKAGIAFHLLFGGGATYGCGEDTIFLRNCLEKKLKMIAVPVALAELKAERDSSWFSGWTDKYFQDKGALYAHLYAGITAKMIAFYICFRHRNGEFKEYGWKKAFRQMCEGIKNYR